MLQYNPVPGQIYDIINIISLKLDQESFVDNYKLHNLHKTSISERTDEIWSYVISSDIQIHNELKLMFYVKNDSNFITYYMNHQLQMLSFKTVSDFIYQLQHPDRRRFTASIFEFYDDYKKSYDEYDKLIDCQGEAAEFIAGLELDSELKTLLFYLYVCPEGFFSKFSSAFTQAKVILEDLQAKFHSYIEEKIADYNNEEFVLDIIKRLLVDSADEEQPAYVLSLSYVNDIIFYQLENCVILGCNSSELTFFNRYSSVDIQLVGIAFSDNRRLQVLKLLENGTMYSTEIAKALSIPNSSLFYHMDLLLSAGFVKARTVGRKTYYSLNVEIYRILEGYFAELYASIKRRRELK